jgi:hypothetical protein
MIIKNLTKESEFKEYSDVLIKFETQFTYPLGDKKFHISHGNKNNDYFYFFKKLGEVNYFIIEEKHKVIGVGAAILKTVIDQEEKYKYWYLADFKIMPKYRKKGYLKKIILKYFLRSYFKSQRMICVNMSKRNNNHLIKKIEGLFSWFNLKTTPYYFYEWDFYKFITDISTNKFISDNYLLYTNNGIKDIIIENNSQSLYHLVEKNYGLNNYPNQVFEINNENLEKIPKESMFMLSTVKKSQVDKLKKSKIRFNYDVSFISHRIKVDHCSFFSGEI